MRAWEISQAWAAVRALHEGATPTLRLLGLVINRSEKEMLRRATEEGWQGVTETIGRERQAKLQKQIAKLDAHIETLIGEADVEAGGFDKMRIDALNALTRTIERLREMMPGGAAIAAGDAKERDAFKASILQAVSVSVPTKLWKP